MEKLYDPFKNVENVYIEFRKAQSIAKGKPYRLPKDFEKHLNNKMSKVNRKSLSVVTNWFITKWSGVSIGKYFECGFELFNNFTYRNFADPRILKLYISRDKLIKRKAELGKRNIIDSVKFVLKYIREHKIKSTSIYCMIRQDGKSLPIIHYLNNDIDRYFLTWMIREKYVHLNDYEMSVIPYITDKYREILDELAQNNRFLEKLKEKL